MKIPEYNKDEMFWEDWVAMTCDCGSCSVTCGCGSRSVEHEEDRWFVIIGVQRPGIEFSTSEEAYQYLLRLGNRDAEVVNPAWWYDPGSVEYVANLGRFHPDYDHFLQAYEFHGQGEERRGLGRKNKWRRRRDRRQIAAKARFESFASTAAGRKD